MGALSGARSGGAATSDGEEDQGIVANKPGPPHAVVRSHVDGNRQACSISQGDEPFAVNDPGIGDEPVAVDQVLQTEQATVARRRGRTFVDILASGGITKSAR